MRIIFVVIGNSRRRGYLNGDTVRNGGAGASGTDTSNILVAEYLAEAGHEVIFCTDGLEPEFEKRNREIGINPPTGEIIRGVQYTDILLTGINNNEFELLINNLWYEKYDQLPIKVTKGIIYWSHMQWLYGVSPLKEYAKKHNLPIGIVHVSEWEKSQTVKNENFLREDNQVRVESQVIPNPVFDEIITKVLNENITKKKNKFIFHALWSRGGNVAVEVVRNLILPDKEFHAFDYLISVHGWEDDFFINHQSVDKETLFRHLAESEYFIYPLYTPYKDVHKDTFACTVAEAIALGVTVITYPLGALPENFTDYCIFLDIPEGTDIHKIQSEPLTKDEDGIFNVSAPFTKKVEELINTGYSVDIEKNKNYILDNFNIQNIGQHWVNFIDRLI